VILFLVSIVVSLALSTFVGCELGFNSYGPIALIAFGVLFGIFHMNERAHRRGQRLKIETTVGRAAVDLATQLGLALYLAMTWPSLPLYRLARTMDPRRRAAPSGVIGPALLMRTSVKILMSPDAIAAPASAFFHGTPTSKNGGKIMIVRAMVQPNRRTPDPFFFSNTSAAVAYVGSAACESASPEAKPSFIPR
jgi:hypothetical protein